MVTSFSHSSHRAMKDSLGQHPIRRSVLQMRYMEHTFIAISLVSHFTSSTTLLLGVLIKHWYNGLHVIVYYRLLMIT